jgi:chromosome segregation ATPase
VNANFEDLLGALRGEIQDHRNERDNLRDEIVPQLRARLEGLESEAADLQRLTYENTRMQQELQSLRNENNTLVNARKLQLDMQQQQMRFNSIAEEGRATNTQVRVGLTRSNTVTRNSISGAPRSSSLSRSNSLKDKESRETLVDRVKDIEAQRDALHSALKSLLERQEHQERENVKRIRALEVERDRANSGSPRRIGYDRNVWRLREEINHLRRRADEALLQKWQCEKGLGGLKMDLDRAEQETGSLRQLLQEHDIVVPERRGGMSNSEARQEIQATSASLERAYDDLQATHALSLARIEGLESRRKSSQRFSQLAARNLEAEKTMELLKQSITDAQAERDLAQKQAEEYRQQADALQEAERSHMIEEQDLADQLRESAVRIEGLAGQVRQQLASNSTLRERLAEAISRGEREQKASAARINEMQSKLKSLEDKLMTAQQHSEEAVSKHEEEIKSLRESHNAQLQRMKNGLKSPSQFSPKTPLSPLFAGKSPRIDRTTSGRGVSISQATKTRFLEKRVEELENALSDADKEMEEVVGRMNMAQIEVMELQSERLVVKPLYRCVVAR